MSAPPVPDRHIHSEWSWDARYGDMLATCHRAVELGVPAIAFTEHSDFTPWVHPRIPGLAGGVRVPENATRSGALDIAGYWESLDRCRAAVPELRIESGIEVGEPHLFPAETAALLGHRQLDRVLGSVHCIKVDGVLTEIGSPGLLVAGAASELMRRYLGVALDLVESSQPFSILTHLDYPKRYWPHAELPFSEYDYEDEYRAVLRALAHSGRALEINSGRATGAPRGPCPGPVAIRWWYEEGGEAVSFGSDAHSPEHVAAGVRDMADLAEAAGFRPAPDPLALWGRG